MRLIELAVRNYKSLRAVRFTPGDLSVVVGANAAGKSNFADSLDFISEVYRHGLELAVARKGGFENMAFRRMRRSKGGISVEVCADVPEGDRHFLRRSERNRPLRIRHFFTFVTKGESIRAEFYIAFERLIIYRKEDEVWREIYRIDRDQRGNLLLSESPESGKQLELIGWPEVKFLADRREPLASTDLLVGTFGRYVLGMHPFVRGMSAMRVFQISPTKSREFGVPLPRPELGGSGGNLPAVVDLLRNEFKAQWLQVMSAMRAVIPQLRDIDTAYTSSRTLGLQFHEHGVGRPWSVGEVSDGTLQTLALLVALFDPRYTVLVMEEPENSVHPWVIRRVLETCKEASKSKQVILTTHSPIVMNAVGPNDVLVMWRRDGESALAPLTVLDPSYVTAWSTGQVPTFEYLDSGTVPEAIPPGPHIATRRESRSHK